MILNLRIIRIDTKYCNYLRNFDNKVPYNMKNKDIRPFIGILFSINECEYFAPLTSPKPKHRTMKNTIDFLKIKGGELGAVNFNNMIPVRTNNYYLIDLDAKEVEKEKIKYQKLLKEQLRWLNSNYYQVRNKSRKLYELYNCGRLPENIKKRCCNFKLLEEKCLLYKV